MEVGWLALAMAVLTLAWQVYSWHRQRATRLRISATHAAVPREGESKAFVDQNVLRRADKAWAEAGVEGVGFHQARHTYASFAIAAGANPKTLSTSMGHSSIRITYDLYGHMLPGDEEAFAEALDKFLSTEAPALDVEAIS